MSTEFCIYIGFLLPILDLHDGPLLMLTQDPEHGDSKYLPAICNIAHSHTDQRPKSRIDLNTGLLINFKSNKF
jgi:hypothetical protein